ncbi:MAG: hypothetical protein AUK20_01725 [Parcubacteria group bacterium CG2_30_45_37]|nr:MAG: hypothetical protein AUK20_01725 [Parcubacteria group bacterium CG2_30_45_37]
MKKFIIENWFKLILGISALIIALSYLWSINIENHRINIEQHREDRLSPSRKTLEEIFNQ